MKKRLSFADALGIAQRPKEAMLNIEVNGNKLTVPRAKYVTAKTKQLREFGYNDLTESHVDEQITACLEGKTLANGLTVIGGFMQDEIQNP